MKIAYQLIAELPKLAWVADVDSGDGLVSVKHGGLVETRGSFFIEGVWNGPYELGGFSQTDCVFGTGAVLTDTGIRFVTSSSITDYLYYVISGTHTYIANSLPLLLATIGDELDPAFKGYSRCNESIIWGIDQYIQDLPTRCGVVKRLLVRNLDVSIEGVKEIEKQLPPPFANYSSYRQYLEANYELIVRNARDPNRSHPLKIYSTQSQGYDTTAVNSIAAKYGVEGVFTVIKGKGRDHFADTDRLAEVDDDGTLICDKLGLKSIPINRRAFESGFDEELLYLSVLDNNADSNLMEINRMISGPAILLTGTLGEIFYPREYFEKRYPYNLEQIRDESELSRWVIKRGDLGTHGLTEVRLEAGFVQLPLFFIGARRFGDILKITASADMDSWRLGRSYDRPIARRIAEDAGVSRNLFGQVKKASVVEFGPPYAPYNRELRKEYFEYLRSNELLSSWETPFFQLIRKVNSLFMFYSPKKNAWLYFAHRAIEKLTRQPFRFPIIWERLNGEIFCFCVNRRIQDYRRALMQMENC